MPISQISAASIREHAEYLSQEVAVIKGSLRDNLFFNKPYTPEAEAWLLQEPILQSLFESKTLDSGIHEGGANLSGGEKQKIALARALMSHQDLLVLDEVCSNIDHASAMDIYRRIDADRDSRITLIISHDELPEGLANIVLNGEETDDGAIRSPQTADSSSHHDHLP
jgi:subfamily B ATP-binding cassette protein MsbA